MTRVKRVPAIVNPPCPRCGRPISLAKDGFPKAHKCPHGRQCVWPRWGEVARDSACWSDCKTRESGRRERLNRHQCYACGHVANAHRFDGRSVFPCTVCACGNFVATGRAVPT